MTTTAAPTYYYVQNGQDWGPFNEDERAEIDRTTKRPVSWVRVR